MTEALGGTNIFRFTACKASSTPRREASMNTELGAYPFLCASSRKGTASAARDRDSLPAVCSPWETSICFGEAGYGQHGKETYGPRLAPFESNLFKVTENRSGLFGSAVTRSRFDEMQPGSFGGLPSGFGSQQKKFGSFGDISDVPAFRHDGLLSCANTVNRSVFGSSPPGFWETSVSRVGPATAVDYKDIDSVCGVFSRRWILYTTLTRHRLRKDLKAHAKACKALAQDLNSMAQECEVMAQDCKAMAQGCKSTSQHCEATNQDCKASPQDTLSTDFSGVRDKGVEERQNLHQGIVLAVAIENAMEALKLLPKQQEGILPSTLHQDGFLLEWEEEGMPMWEKWGGQEEDGSVGQDIGFSSSKEDLSSEEEDIFPSEEKNRFPSEGVRERQQEKALYQEEEEGLFEFEEELAIFCRQCK